MSVCCAIHVTDGVVLAADGRTSMVGDRGHGAEVVHRYSGGRKIVPLPQRRMAVLCWGAGSIGGLSLANLITEAANELALDDSLMATADGLVSACNRAIERPHLPEHNARPHFHMLLLGYGPDDAAPGAMLIRSENGRLLPSQTRAQRLFWAGEGSEAIERLVLGRATGCGRSLHRVLQDQDLERRVLRALDDDNASALVHPEMPLADAAGLARFLIDTACAFDAYRPGVDSTGGCCQLGIIERHHGWRWLQPPPDLVSAHAV